MDYPASPPQSKKYKNDLLNRMGGKIMFEMILNDYIDNILNDESLRVFFAYHPDHLLEDQTRFLDLMFMENPEHAVVRIVLMFYEFTDNGFCQAHYLRLMDHFVNALREYWVDNETIEEVKTCFTEHAGLFPWTSPLLLQQKQQGKVFDAYKAGLAAATSSRKQKRHHREHHGQQQGESTPISSPESKPKKTITAAIQQTPEKIRAFKNKLVGHMFYHPKSPESNLKQPTAAIAVDESRSPGEEKEVSPQAKKSSLRNLANFLAPPEL